MMEPEGQPSAAQGKPQTPMPWLISFRQNSPDRARKQLCSSLFRGCVPRCWRRIHRARAVRHDAFETILT